MYMAKHRANNHREIYIYNLKGLINNTGLGVCTSPWTLSNKVSMHKAVSQGYTQNYAMHKTGLDGCDYHRARCRTMHRTIRRALDWLSQRATEMQTGCDQ